MKKMLNLKIVSMEFYLMLTLTATPCDIICTADVI